ncbi:hypothetical protein B0H13DRAFT_2362545 [Mycena leptocephala]|nr:hypothetical protein B0H13DRAFT_2362545 [Mycena leptocephala]
MLEYLVRCYQAQIVAGITPEDVVFSSSYPILRDASVRACVDLYAWLESADGEAVIKRARCGATHLDRLPLDIPDGPEDTLPESNLDDDDNHDDSDVPLISVVRDALGDRLNAPSTTLPVSTAAHESESKGMSTINDEEDIWAFDDQGWKWADIGALKDDKVADGAEEEEA